MRRHCFAAADIVEVSPPRIASYEDKELSTQPKLAETVALIEALIASLFFILDFVHPFKNHNSPLQF
jgi:sulfur relay (sulfurtransferase) complex TusBCD TusD component (DsrE family)